jgi:hypothetical protein
MKKPRLDALNEDDNQFLVSVTGTKNALVLNAATFPALAALVTSLGTTLTAYNTSLQAAVDANAALSAAIAAKDNDRAAVQAVLRELAKGVDSVAQGDEEIINLGGFVASNDPSPVTMTQVQNLKVVASENEGELLASWGAMPGRVFYRVQVSTDTTTVPTNWVTKLETTKNRCSLNHDLVPGTKVWTRVQVVGANNEGAWSDVVWKRDVQRGQTERARGAYGTRARFCFTTENGSRECHE